MRILMFHSPWFLLLYMAAFSLVKCKEGIIKDDNMNFWYKGSFAIEGYGEHWTDPSKAGPHTAFSETDGGDKNSNFWLITKHINPNINRSGLIYVDIETELSGKLEVYVYLNTHKPTIPIFTGKKDIPQIHKYLTNNFKKVYTQNYSTSEKVTKTFTFSLSKTDGVTLGIKAVGETIGKLWHIKMYYYFCQQTFINSVNFSKTFAPDSGSREVFGKCSQKSSAGRNDSRIKAYCLSNGSWVMSDHSVKCVCLKGYEPNKEKGCLACPTRYFKQNDSNTPCTRCPLNTLSQRDRTRCQCKDGYFKLVYQVNSTLSPCYAPLKMDRQPIINKITNDEVQMAWSRPTMTGDFNDTITFDVKCFICIERNSSECVVPCVDKTFKPRAYNLTQSSVLVSNLSVGTKYEFRVYPKNSLNGQIVRSKWNYSKILYLHKIFKSTKRQTTTAIVMNISPEESDSKQSFPLYIILVAVACVLLMVVTFLVVIILRRRRMEKKGSLLYNAVELPTTGQRMYIDPSNYDSPEAAIGEFASELDPSTIYPEMLIGGGEFGDVYKGIMTKSDDQRISVALKTLKQDATPKSEKDFLLEASIMGQFHHENVVHLEGVVSRNIPRMIVLEFMANGSLDNFLKVNDGRLSQVQLITMARGIASGMEYLAGMNYVHRDLAARNILVNETMVCKVSDFGLSRHLETTDSSRGEYSTTGGKIPMRWTAPEAIKYRKFSSASDVWSYGILLWEIMSFAERPYWEWDNFVVIEKVDEGYRLPAPLSCPKGVHDLMLHCWKQNRAERPNFTSITTVIDTWLETADTMDEDLGSMTLLGQWLKRLKMGNYIGNFTTAGYDKPSQVMQMTDERLKEMGIQLVGHRNKILKGIKVLKEMQKQRELKREISLEV